MSDAEPLRVCVVGSESTGKTTLCARLALHYQTTWVPEYPREYALEKVRAQGERVWEDGEFEQLALEQQRREDDYALRARRVLLCDTDAFAVRVWFERYHGRPPAAWPHIRSHVAHYLIPYPDVPFVADEIRDGERFRWWMYERFVALFDELGRPYTVLRGTYDERFVEAVELIDGLLEREVSAL
ncbi:MAG TPA: ATP-binding protein [Candidatus Acidoferrales bacterium]|nr:ATP-binding protein [Candidatus Acidoferrales bacterium]